MAPYVAANVLKGLWETAELNAGTVHMQACPAYMFTQPVTCPNLRSKKKKKEKEKAILPFSRQINPQIQVNSPIAQEIPVSHAIRDCHFCRSGNMIFFVITSANAMHKFERYTLQVILILFI